MVTQGHGEHPAAASRRRTLGKKFTTTNVPGAAIARGARRARDGVADLRPGARQRPSNAIPSCVSPSIGRPPSPAGQPRACMACLVAANQKASNLLTNVSSEYDQVYHRKAQAKLRLSLIEYSCAN